MRIKHDGIGVARDDNPIGKEALFYRVLSLQASQMSDESEVRNFKAFLDADHPPKAKANIRKHLGRMIPDVNKNKNLIDALYKELDQWK